MMSAVTGLEHPALAQTAQPQPSAPSPNNAPQLQIGALVYPRMILRIWLDPKPWST
jgi:hypothetical protein